MTREEALRYLMKDGNLRVPAGRYGSDTESCAPVAYAVAEIVAEATGDPITLEDVEHAMGLVVNSHDDVLSLIRDHGAPAQQELIADALYEEYEGEAYELGRQHALAAATWIADGNTKAEFIPAVLRMFEDGDPALENYLPNTPNLSGEWADDPTPQSLYEEITGRRAADRISENEDAEGELIDALADAYERGVDDHFIDACETELRKWIR